MSWLDVVGKLIARGVSIFQIRSMTLYMAFSTLYAMNEDDEFRVKLAGGTIEDGDKEATLQDILGLGG